MIERMKTLTAKQIGEVKASLVKAKLEELLEFAKNQIDTNEQYCSIINRLIDENQRLQSTSVER